MKKNKKFSSFWFHNQTLYRRKKNEKWQVVDKRFFCLFACLIEDGQGLLLFISSDIKWSGGKKKGIVVDSHEMFLFFVFIAHHTNWPNSLNFHWFWINRWLQVTISRSKKKKKSLKKQTTRNFILFFFSKKKNVKKKIISLFTCNLWTTTQEKPKTGSKKKKVNGHDNEMKKKIVYHFLKKEKEMKNLRNF